MPTYITLFNWTRQGIENIEDSPDRYDAGVEIAESLGGEIVGFYLTFGRYDTVLVSEFPDDESHARFLLGLGSGGNVRSETLKAFTEDEYREIIEGIPE